jgi:transposase
MAEPVDEQQEKALLRYQIISAYLAMEPTRGQRGPLLEQLAKKTWVGRNGEPYVVSAETIRVWIRRFRRHGLDGLRDKRRPRRGVIALPQELVDLVIKLKREVPERSLDRIIVILESMGFCEKGIVRRSTLHRVLKREGISARPTTPAGDKDLDRFEADHANDLWQSDLLNGPWLPDPERPSRVRRACLYAFIDDHSRLLLHGRFSFKGELPHLEIVFRRCVQKWGVPRRVYYDNGQVYRSGQMRQVVATLGIHGMVFTQKWRPMGHGKIEALNKFLTSNFVAEVKASRIKTLDELNEAFVAFADLDYNKAIHGETNETPLARWKKDVERVRYVDEKLVLRAFLWREHRTTDKTGIFSLFGVRYQTGALCAKKRIEVRYDPERTDEVDVYLDGRFVERVKPFAVSTHRRPHTLPPASPPAPPGPPTADWLSHLVEQRRKDGFVEEAPRALSEEIARERAIADAAIVSLLEEHVHEDVFDERAITDFVARYGPFDEDKV